MNLSKFFIDRPIFAGVLSMVIFLAGAIAMNLLPISEYPEVVPPSVVVRAAYPGANPKVIAETVATPLEEQINGVENMLYMSSQATTDGALTLTVTFKLGTDPDKAQQLVQNRVSQAEARLPQEVRTLGITTAKASSDLTMVVHLVSPNERYDLNYLRNYGVLNVKDRLRRVPGVGDVQIFGAGDYSMRVWLDPSKVAAGESYNKLTFRAGADFARTLGGHAAESVVTGAVAATPNVENTYFGSKRPFRNRLSVVQLVEQRLGLLQIERVEAFGEPAVDRREQLARFVPLALITPKPRHTHRRAQFQGFCLLRPRYFERTFKMRLRRIEIRLG